jgi:amino acid adenylation domain-containing protein
MEKTIVPLEKGINFSNLFERHLENLGDKIAVDDGRNQLTYQQLELLSNLIAAELVKNNFKKGDIFMLFTKREVLTIATVFGVLKAGGIFIPVDSETPIERLRFIREDVQCTFVTSDIKEKLQLDALYGLPVADFIQKIETSTFEEVHIETPEITGEDLCYIIYTSGSTGRPKGVPISQNNFMGFVDSMETVYRVNTESKCMNTIPFHFDASMEDFYALYQGAYLYITPSFTIPSLLTKIMKEKEITHVATTPSILNLMYNSLVARKDKVWFEHLQTIIMGGDICEKKIINFLFELSPTLELINGYGPTEATCDAITYTLTEPFVSDGFLPIGIPLKHIDFLLIDQDGNEVEKGEKGELILSGKQVFKGYVNREEETKRSFITINGVAYYKTGDVCIINENGDLVFLGRNNDELKLNGFRVNLNEVRTVIMNLEFVKTAEVVVVEKGDGEKKSLSAAIELRVGEDASRINEIPEIIKRYLPFYMIPNRYVLFEDFPLLSSSKIDKKKIKTMLNQEKAKQKDTFYLLESIV